MTTTKNKGILGTLALGAMLILPGCDQLFDAFEPQSKTVVNVFATHHATPDDGVVPDRGGDGEYRIFENDEGWTVYLVEGFVTIQEVTLHRCDGEAMPIDLYFGSVPEDFTQADLDRISVGGTEVDAADFCALTVHYGPYVAGTDVSPEGIDADVIDGATVHLSGYAERGEEMAPFDVRVEEMIAVRVELDSPLQVTGDESFPLEVTVAKTYDRFFDGISFDDLGDVDLNAQAMAVLELETRVETE